MNIPTISACNLLTKQQNSFAVHNLKDFIKDNIYVPKKAHRHTFFQVLYIEKGSGTHHIDFVKYHFKANSLFFLSPGQVHQLIINPIGIKGFIINFNESFFYTFLANPSLINNFPFFKNDGKFSFYKVQKKIILQTLIKLQKPNKPKLLRLYLLELFYLIDELHQINAEDTTFTSSQKLISELDTLIEKNYDIEHYPKFYAKKLSVTPSHLNVVCQKVRNKTAGDLIRERILLESKRLLVNSKLTISEIAYLLGYDDNSYFTKFFKSQENKTPTQFRRLL